MSDEPSGAIAQVVLMMFVAALWCAVAYAVRSLFRGWRP